MTYVKEYLVAPSKRVFQFAQTWDNGVWLDEVIKSDRSCRVFFDIEIKLGQFTSIPETDILREHVNGLGVDHTEDDLATVVEAYRWDVRDIFTEKLCLTRINVLLDYICCCFGDILHDAPDETLQINVLTGCCPKNFSFHVIAKYIFSDSTVLTMPLLVFEIAHRFSVENTKWLFNNLTQEK